ncbi:hypothetical protein [Variovorax boronicumulans]|uniref:hypothetical protein n=1 Tax=Variovorax boronicumulans TaxID=436515 RepID=UPI00085C512C|nr:hypothetical protein [Variovorax boronicumulans]OEZ31334.1 hypothetical protein AO062_08075 [Variovorax boronicumulans]
MQAIQIPTHFLSALVLSAYALAVPATVQAQVNPEIANCVELKDEATVTQADLCAAHIGCRFVLNVQKTCARAKGYLERLQTAIGEGTRTFFGSYRKEVTPDAIFTAVEHEESRSVQRKVLDGSPDSLRRVQEIGKQVRETGPGETLTADSPNTGLWVYYGQTREGRADGLGTRIFSNGEVQRGQFVQNKLQGATDILFVGGDRYIGHNGSSIQGSYLRADGSRFEGTFEGKKRSQGREYRPDGTLAEEGRYASDKLSVGTQYDVAGVRTEVNMPAAREAAAREAAEKARIAAEAESRRKREEAAQAEQQFQSGLQTLNPGQLFARADELKAQGDHNRARQVQRALTSRFPDHPLAATAARQMAGESGGSPTSAGSAVTASRPAGGRLSAQTCDAMKQSVIATKVPSNASITASQETVMFMTKTVLDMIAGDCPTEPGVTSAQIDAERKARQQQYTAAENACNAVQSGGRRCVPQAHTAATAAVSKLPVAPSASSAQPGNSISYDPVTGRCIGPREICTCQPGIDVSGCPSRSSGGGARTAR